jgi:hypothetical protein
MTLAESSPAGELASAESTRAPDFGASRERTAQRVAIIGRPGRIEGAWRKSVPQLMDNVGENTGNLAFWYAISRQIAGPKTYFGWGLNPEEIKRDYDVVVFAAANQLNPKWDLGSLAERLEATDKPLVVIGLGAQADKLGDKVELQPGTQRLLSLFAERCTKIGMRGEYSASVAQSYGAKNVEVIGCPSNFINTAELELGANIAERMAKTTTPYRIVVNLDLHSHLASTIRRCVAWLEEWSGSFVVQNNANLVNLAIGHPEAVPHEDLDKIGQLLFNQRWSEKIRQFLLSQISVFFDAEAWMTAVRPSRLSIGTRLHGNILPFQAGVPAIMVPHDGRTAELVETIGLPSVDHQQINDAASLPELMKSVEFDGAAFDRRRRALAGRYVDLLNASGVPVAPDLVKLATPSPAPSN